MLKVFFDLQILNFQKYGGISTYFYNIILNFIKYPEIGVMPVLSNNKKNYFFLLRMKQDYPRAFSKNKNLSNYLLSKKNMNANYELVHFSYYHPNILLLSKSPKISTIHDFIPEIEFGKFSKNHYLHSFKKVYLNRSDGVIYVSNTTKSLAENLYPKLKNKPHKVIHHGADLPPNTNLKKKGSDDNFFLYIGKRSLYKNFDAILPAFGLLTKDTDLFLYCYGGGEFSNKELKCFSDLGILNRVRYLDPKLYVLDDLFKKSVAFINSSNHEGFGLTNLEALASGCRVLCSDIPVFREVLGRHATFFHPTDFGSIFIALRSVVGLKKGTHIKHNQEYISKNFSWKDKAFETSTFYKSILKK